MGSSRLLQYTGGNAIGNISKIRKLLFFVGRGAPIHFRSFGMLSMSTEEAKAAAQTPDSA